MKRHLWLALLAGSVQAAAPAASTSLSTAPQQQDLNSVRKEIDSLKKDIAEKQAAQKEAKSAIQQSEQAIAQTNQALATLQQKQGASKEQLDELRARIRQSQHDIAAVRERVRQMLARQYKSGQHDAMTMMFNAGDPNQTARDLAYYQHIAKAQQQLAAQLATRQQELEGMQAQLEQELERLGQQSAGKSREKHALVSGKSNQQQQLNRVSGEIRQSQDKLTQLKEDEKRLSNLIAQINREIQRRKAEAARKAAEARKARQEAARKENERRKQLAAQAKKQGKPVPEEVKKPVVVKEEAVDEVADDSAAGRAFGSLQGKMKMPVAGSIAGRYGTQRPGGTKWKGVFIKTSGASPVRSVADGNVVYADALRGFGNTVIVDHGGNYMTVYSGLSAIGKSLGSRVKAGDTIGNSGALDSGEAGLYFEIRHLGQPLNPQAWAR